MQIFLSFCNLYLCCVLKFYITIFTSGGYFITRGTEKVILIQVPML